MLKPVLPIVDGIWVRSFGYGLCVASLLGFGLQSACQDVGGIRSGYSEEAMLGDADGAGTHGVDCVDDQTFFEDHVYTRVLATHCQSCHSEVGAGRYSDFVLAPSIESGYLEKNRETLTRIARVSVDDVSLVLLKPVGFLNHGGGVVLSQSSFEYELIADFVARLDAPVLACTGDEEGGEVEIADGRSLELLTPLQTLRKAGLMLVGRLPQSVEVDEVRLGAESGLINVLDRMMDEGVFFERIVEVFNDRMLTDKYLDSGRIIAAEAAIRGDVAAFPYAYWPDSLEGVGGDNRLRNALRGEVSRAIAREPLELIAYIVRNRLPFTDILKADYTVANTFSAGAMGAGATVLDSAYDEAGSPMPGIYDYGVDRYPEPDDVENRRYFPVRMAGLPHAGILTTTAYLNRYPTTPTNRNRHRVWALFKQFLATDILSFAERPVDTTAVTVTHNPSQNDPQCTVCHATMDPVAGLFQNWGSMGERSPPESGWYEGMPPPGFGGDILPGNKYQTALRWLADKIVADGRFPLSVVQIIFEGLTGLSVLQANEVAGDAMMIAAYEQQAQFISGVSTAFADRGFEIRQAITDIVLSPYFRAVGHRDALDSTLTLMGTAHLLTPEELERKIETVMGYPWRYRVNNRRVLLSERDYLLLYGGIDSDSITERLAEPNGVMGALGLRMASEVACFHSARDFLLNREERRLFPYVELEWQPETDAGFSVPRVVDDIRENIRYLHLRFLGEDLSVDDAEIDFTYQLFYDTWKAGKAALEQDQETACHTAHYASEDDSGSPSVNLTYLCRVNRDFWSDESLPNAERLTRDPSYTMRAWMTVVSYLLSDYLFLYE